MVGLVAPGYKEIKLMKAATQLEEAKESLGVTLPKLFPKHKYVNYKQIVINEEYRAMNPVMEPREFNMVLEDIRKNGFYTPVSVNQKGVLLDGFHRLKISKILGGVEFPIQVLKFKNKQDELRYVKTVNLMRRQVKSSVRIFELSQLYPELFSGIKATKRQGLSGLPPGLKGIKETKLRSMIGKYKIAEKIALADGRLEVTQKDIEKATSGKALSIAQSLKQGKERTATVVRSIASIASSVNRSGPKQIKYDHVVMLQPVAQKLLVECNRRIAAGK